MHSTNIAALSQGLTLSPLRSEFSIDQGTSQEGTLTLTNNNDSPITVNLSVEEFSVIDPQYDYAFNSSSQLTKWVTFTPDIVDLAVGQTTSVSFKVGVPVDAEPGGRYLSMFATTDTRISSEGIASKQRIASLIYLTVNGDFSRSGQLASLNTPWFLVNKFDWSASIHNTGTAHFNSRYSLLVQELFGNKTISNSNGSALILPSTIRSIKDSAPLPTLPGIYKAVYTIGLGDSPAVTETHYFIYMPLSAIFALIISLLIIAGLIGEYRYRKKRISS